MKASLVIKFMCILHFLYGTNLQLPHVKRYTLFSSCLQVMLKELSMYLLAIMLYKHNNLAYYLNINMTTSMSEH